MSEIQVPYVIQLIERWRDGEYDEVACTRNALERFNKHLKDAMGESGLPCSVIMLTNRR